MDELQIPEDGTPFEIAKSEIKGKEYYEIEKLKLETKILRKDWIIKLMIISLSIIPSAYLLFSGIISVQTEKIALTSLKLSNLKDTLEFQKSLNQDSLFKMKTKLFKTDSIAKAQNQSLIKMKSDYNYALGNYTSLKLLYDSLLKNGFKGRDKIVADLSLDLAKCNKKYNDSIYFMKMSLKVLKFKMENALSTTKKDLNYANNRAESIRQQLLKCQEKQNIE